MNPLNATDVLANLSANELRSRLSALAAEEKALRVLLRAAVQLEKVSHEKQAPAKRT